MLDEIKQKWISMGGESSSLGNPYSGTMKTIREDGYFQRFQHGSIYWSSTSGAFEIHGGVESKYMSMGYEASYLKYPTFDTVALTNGCSFNDFMGGAIYFNPLFSGHALYGPILEKWREMGAEKSVMGYPTGDTEPTIDGEGQFQHFQAGDLYWHPEVGIFGVKGRIRLKWYELGGVEGELGYPVSEVMMDGETSSQKFQHGKIT
ncbi:MAG: hypothetical protein KAR76_03455, partial [Methanosarcinales archaeon]|nr:hypothetical protein [Methanosarcinales archaeon]